MAPTWNGLHMTSRTRWLAAALGLGVAGVAAALALRGGEGPAPEAGSAPTEEASGVLEPRKAAVERPPWKGEDPVPFVTDKPLPAPAHKLSRYPPGTWIPIKHLPKVDKGIPMPDGTFLPFLNGMTYAPPIHRDPSLGPVPPVIAKAVDWGGFEWWIHADGSATTSRYEKVTVGDKVYWDPASAHLAPKKANQLMAEKPPPPGGGSGRAR